MQTNLDRTILKVVELLKKGPKTCTQVGAALYGKSYRKHQAYARPGGRILHRMKRLGLVEQRYDGRHFYEWHLLPGYERIAEVFKREGA